MASTKISRTPSGAGNRDKWTISLWLKRAKLGVEQVIASCYGDSNNQTQIKFESDNQLYFNDENSGNTNGRIVSNAKYLDTNSWYHMVFIWDKDNSTSGDKIRMYVNGERVTSFSDTGNAPSASSEWNSTTTQQFGAKSSSDYFDGVMSHIHFCDGYAYDPSYFGETDSTTGEWKIKTSPSVSYGTNGYFWLKDNVATTDNSPNSNTFTASGTLTKTEDCPSNVFAVINRHSLNHSDLAHLEYGNTQVAGSTSGSVKWYGASTLAFTKGKFYCEILNKTTSNASLSVGVSMNPSRNQRENHAVGARNSDIGTENYSGNIVINNSNVSVGYGSTWTANNDICMLAIDADNNKFYVGKNGVWANSDNPSNGTGGYDMSSVVNHAESSSFYHFAFGSTSGSYMNSFSVNFGNGYFGITAVSSNSGNGYSASGSLGKFQYQPPTGFTALCTKGLNE